VAVLGNPSSDGDEVAAGVGVESADGRRLGLVEA
jgi:hypothetical protein